MPGVRRKKRRDGTPYPYWSFWYLDEKGKRRWGSGTPSKSETLRIAKELEAEHQQARNGHRAPKPYDDPLPFVEIRDEFLDWGEACGGRGGRPWSPGHARMRRAHLKWWGTQLNLDDMADLNGCLPAVEHELRGLRRKKRAPKTIASYADAIHAFCEWAVKREYLEENPLKHLPPLDKTPQITRRALTEDELVRLLEKAHPRRQPMYEVAVCSGLRAGELRALQVRHLDVKRSGLRLDASWTKNRKPGFQPLPRPLVDRLARVVEGKAADDPLLFVPKRPVCSFEWDLKRAGIEKKTSEGKLDFHALRTAYVTLLSETGATWKETKTLARHESLAMTDLYARTRDHRLRELTDAIGRKLERGTRSVCRSDSGERRNPSTAGVEVGGQGGIRTRTPVTQN